MHVPPTDISASASLVDTGRHEQDDGCSAREASSKAYGLPPMCGGGEKVASGAALAGNGFLGPNLTVTGTDAQRPLTSAGKPSRPPEAPCPPLAW